MSIHTAHWETGEAFKGLPDADVWRRPNPRLLSVGELASHVVYWEAQSFLGVRVDSPLIVPLAQYYSSNATEPFALLLGVDEVLHEVHCVHALCKAASTTDPRDSETPNPNREGWTWGFTLE